MDTIEIPDDEIDVEEIMQKIRDNISRRKDAYTASVNPEVLSSSSNEVSKDICGYTHDLAILSGNWDIRNNSYSISSHRPLFGSILVKGRSLVHGEVCRYIDPIIWNQMECNRRTVNTLMGLEGRISLTDDRLRDIDSTSEQLRMDLTYALQETEQSLRNEFSLSSVQLRDEFSLSSVQLRDELINAIHEKEQFLRDDFSRSSVQLRNDLTDLFHEVNQRFREDYSALSDKLRSDMDILSSQLLVKVIEEVQKQVQSSLLDMDDDVEKRAWLAKVLEGRISNPHPYETEADFTLNSEDSGINYMVFEDRFRGSRKDISQRQRAFLEYFEGCRNVLDIGCGRGEFLELMKEQGIGARGVDLDETMVDYCRTRGLEVELNDALTYLEQLEDASLDGIFIDQVVEHLEPGYLIRLLKLCHQKLKYGFYLVAETVNPLSFTSFANFYIDITHIRPVHPETLKFLYENAGFRELEVQFLSPVPVEARLQMVPIGEDISEMERHRIEIYNGNIQMLNGVLYGAQDYVIVGKK